MIREILIQNSNLDSLVKIQLEIQIKFQTEKKPEVLKS